MTGSPGLARRWVALPLAAAGLWGLGLIAAAGTVPVLSGTSQSAGVTTSTSSTLVEEVGGGAYAMAGLPLVATVLVAGLALLRPRIGPVVAAGSVVGVLAIFNLLAMLTIGIFLLPATGALVVAVGAMLSRVVGAASYPPTVEPVIRVISGDDWAALRGLRLRALADSPDAFGITLAEVETLPEAEWRDRARGPGPVIMAFVGEDPVAMGGLHVPEDSPDAFVWGMWVEPGLRGRGLGARILRDLVDGAERLDRPVTLHVTEGNDGARRVYEAHGFVATGEWQPLREGSELMIETMRHRRRRPRVKE